MATSLEPAQPTSSLSERRPAAMGLPNMSLPPLPFGQAAPTKLIPFNVGFGSSQPYPSANYQTNVGNLLTPPSTLAGESLSPISTILQEGTNSGGSVGVPVPGGPTCNHQWLSQPTGTTPLGPPSGNTPQWQSQMKGLFSPSLFSTLPRNGPNPSGVTETLPPPPAYDFSNPPAYASSTPMSAPSSVSVSTAQQQADAQSYMATAAQAQEQTQTPISASMAQASPATTSDLYTQRPQSTPSTYQSTPSTYTFGASISQPTSAQQHTFPAFSSASSPTQSSPLSAPLPGQSRMPTMHGQGLAFPSPGSQIPPYGFRPYTAYALPQLGHPGLQGPVMTNMHSPGNNMALMGMPGPPMPGGMIPGYHSGVAAQMYGAPQQSPPNDRPFKCDQCPQSFNRNHDLKRHKRIHLAVKPFPCGHCDKSFSRKDALKRHILVKGCGKNSTNGDRTQRSASSVKSEDEDSTDTDYIAVESKSSL